MPSRVCRSLLVCLALSLGAVAHAAPAQPAASDKPEIDRARKSYAEGVAAYRIGRYDEAAKLFEEAYRITKFPSMLFDIAQSYRRLYETTKNLDSLARSLDLYRAFLRDAPPAADRRPVAEKLVPQLEHQLASESRRRREEMMGKVTGREALFVAEQLIGEGAPKDAASVLDRLLGAGGNPRDVLVAALEKRALVAGRLGDRTTAEESFKRALALAPGLRLTDEVDPKTKEAYAAAKRYWEGKRPLTLSHVPHGQVPKNKPVEIPVSVESDPLGLVAELVVSYRLSGAGAFSASRAAPDKGTVEIPAAFLGSAGGSRVEYYVTALDRMGNELVALGSPKTPFLFTVEGPPRETVPAAAMASDPWYRKWWVWTLVGGAVVAGTTGAYLATRSDPYNPPAIRLPSP